jgi:hypothetical protein
MTFSWTYKDVLALLKRYVQGDLRKFTGCLKYIHEGNMAGIGIIIVSKFPWDERQLIAQEQSWHADPLLPGRLRGRIISALYNEMEKWAIDYGATIIKMQVPCSQDYEQLGRFFARRGFIRDSYVMYKEVR